MSECELTNCVWGKRACQGAGREFLHLSVIGPYPWDARALFSYGAGCGRPGRWRSAIDRRHRVLLPPTGSSDLACGRPLTAPHGRPGATAAALLPAARQRPNSRFFRAAMSIAKRIWPAILIDSKFSTKLCHGTGLSPIFSD